MRRREFITLLGGTVAAWPLVARAERIARVGYLGLTSATSVQAARIDAFRAGLRDLGYVEGKNIEIEFRFAGGDNDRLPGLAAELIRLNVDVIVTYATGVPSARRITATTPIVMATFGDAVAALAAKHRLPSIGPLELAASGGLMAYGVNFSDMYRRAAAFVDKILKGAKPGDIPVEQVTRIQTIVNVRTAKSIGIQVPTTLLLRADGVIE